MDLTSIAMDSANLAASGRMAQYSYGVANMALRSSVQSAKGLFDMLPQQQALQVRGPQPGDIPAVAKGSILDVYA